MSSTIFSPLEVEESGKKSASLTTDKSRHNYLDLSKGLAIFLVIETHAREMAGTNFYGFILKTAFYSLDRNGVLLFFLCSGALLLSKDTFDTAKLFKRCFRLTIILSIYSIVTNSVFYIADGKNALLEIKDALLFNNMLTSFNYDKAIHLWFLCAYIPLLLASPLIGLAVRSMSGKALTFSISLLFLCGPLSKVMTTIDIQGFELFDAGDKATFLMYMVIGYAIHNDRLMICKTKPYLALLVAVISAIISVICQNFMFTSGFFNENDWRVLSNYSSSIFLLPSAVFLFIFLRNAKIKSNIIERIGRCSFGIYLTHYMIMKCMFMVIPKFSSLLEKYVMSMIMALVALLLSMIASGLLARLRLSYLVR
ncbi:MULTISPECIES: acyltransferase [Phytobacter]|uniref:Acyltransferase n=1 Tax=Citrobacter bitternis TaxID=1585982 RepID=A0ABW1Q5H1_9ENTR|nr:acyltransferase [Phytobacter sp. SCO41]